MNKPKWHAYGRLMRFHKPVGILLLLWPTLWALWLANQGWPPLRLLVIFTLGVVITRSAGCIANDWADRNFDGHVARTRDRPLASGQLSSQQALSALSLLGLAALLLVACLNAMTVVLSVIAAALALIYPFMKRYSHWPQLVLGLAFAMPVPMAFSASLNHIPAVAWLLWLIAVIWPLMYDTAYAITDQQDDAKLGLKSTALYLGSYSALFIGVLQLLFIGLWSVLAWWQHLAWPFWLSLSLGVLAFGYQQFLLARSQAFQAFLNNQWLGGVLWCGLCLALK